MNFLLDSHVVIWAMSAPERLKAATRCLLESPSNILYVSAATLWELELKASKGKLVLPQNFADLLAGQDFTPLPIGWNHTRLLRWLPAIHADPFDRLLLAQAHAEGMTFVTADQTCLQYPVALMSA